MGRRVLGALPKLRGCFVTPFLLGRALSSRAVKVTLYLWILVWGLDRAIFWATEAAWFGSVGQGAWFGARFWAQFALFWTTLALALASATLAMRVAARPAAGRRTGALCRSRSNGSNRCGAARAGWRGWLWWWARGSWRARWRAGGMCSYRRAPLQSAIRFGACRSRAWF